MANGARDNIILIGMPGAGKSTVGVLLAKKLASDFIDTDLLIQKSTGRTLQNIADSDGYLALRSVEEGVLLTLMAQRCVIATGGSAVYSDRAMQQLKSGGIAVLLELDLSELLSRVGDFSNRGLAKRTDQSFGELFEERHQLYSKYADITINCAGLNQEQVCSAIIQELQSHQIVDK